jgi:hypothetical protein
VTGLEFWVALSEIIRNLGIVVGGGVGIWLAWNRVVASNKQADAQLRQAELSRRDHVAELFNRAVGQLKDEKLEVRLGAILTLDQICLDFSDLSAPVIELLTAYIREAKVEYGENDVPADIAVVVRIVTRVSAKESEKDS